MFKYIDFPKHSQNENILGLVFLDW